MSVLLFWVLQSWTLTGCFKLILISACVIYITGSRGFLSCSNQRKELLQCLISCLSDWTICWFDGDRKPCLYPITWRCLSPITWSTELRVWTVLTFYSVIYNIYKYKIAYQIGQSFDFAMIENPSCRRFYPLLVLECVRTQVVMTSLGDVKRPLPSWKIGQMLLRTENILWKWSLGKK